MGKSIKISRDEYAALIALRDDRQPRLLADHARVVSLLTVLQHSLAAQRQALQCQDDKLVQAHTAHAQTVTMLADVIAVVRRSGGWMAADDQALLRAAETLLRAAGWVPRAADVKGSSEP
jgi:hypothetical protein